MISVLKWLLALALTVPVAMLGYLLAKDAGRLSIRAWGWQIDTTLVLALSILIMTALMIFALHWLLWRLPLHLLRKRQTHIAAQYRLGLEDFLLGRFQKAKRRLSAAAAIPEHAPTAWMFAALSADALGESKEAQAFAAKAAQFEAIKPAADCQALESRLSAGDLSALAELETAAGSNPLAAKLLAQHLSKRGRAQDALNAIQLSQDKASNKGADWAAMVRLALEQAATPSQLEEVWERLSQSEREQADVLYAYVESLNRLDSSANAWQMLQAGLKKHNSDLLWQALVRLTPTMSENDLSDALRLSERQLERSAPEELPNHLLSMANLCFQLKQIGKAKQFLARSIDKSDSADARKLMGQIKLAEGDHLGAATDFQQALKLL
jgi:uncharacterized protein HemY